MKTMLVLANTRPITERQVRQCGSLAAIWRPIPGGDLAADFAKDEHQRDRSDGRGGADHQLVPVLRQPGGGARGPHDALVHRRRSWPLRAVEIKQRACAACLASAPGI